MWQSRGFLLAIMAFSSGLAEDSNPCVTSLSYIQVVERYRKTGDFQTYELCPNRTFQLPSTNPLQITKSNLHLTCKGCVIANSQVEVLGNTGADITNVIMEGISFRSSNVVVRARGSVAIVGCRFEQESSLTTQSLSWVSNDSSPPLTVRISTSLFLNNFLHHGDSKGLLNFDNTFVQMQDSIIAGTTTSNPGRHIIRVENGAASFRDNCFVGNAVSMTPIVATSSSNSVSGTFWQRRNPDAIVPITNCPFLASGDSIDGPFVCSTPTSSLTCNAASLESFADAFLPCETSLDAIQKNEEALISDHTPRTYILCPRTKYPVDTPLVITRPNVRLLCGADGRSRNECVFTGGEIQLKVGPESLQSPIRPLTNLLVQGLTFTSSTEANVIVQYPCDLTIEKCIFMVSTEGLAFGQLTYTAVTQDNGNLASIQIGPSDEHNLDMHVIVSKTAFAANRMGTKRGVSTGVIVNKGGSLLIADSNFLGNRDVWIDHRYSNYVIGNLDGRLEMRGNCFVGNDVEFSATVSRSAYRPVLEGNYGPESSAACGFVAIASDSQDTGYDCLDFDRPTCFVKNGYVVGYNDGPHWKASVQTAGASAPWSSCIVLVVAFLGSVAF